MAKVIKPPSILENGASIFLAGSIEMGTAENWQSRVEKALSEKDIIIYNPRRDDWDSSWEQKIENDKFYEQVRWELAALEKASVIAMYFDPKTKSPISLLELGLFARTNRLVVCCPEGFWRKGNVDIVCHRYDIVNTSDFNDFVAMLEGISDVAYQYQQRDKK